MIVTVLIGNSDNKLTQQRWSDFCAHLGGLLEDFAVEVHFRGYAPSDALWQNAATVFEMREGDHERLIDYLEALTIRFDQESIAYILADEGTRFARRPEQGGG